MNPLIPDCFALVLQSKKQLVLFIDRFNTLITLHQRELKKLKNVKESLLEKMFV